MPSRSDSGSISGRGTASPGGWWWRHDLSDIDETLVNQRQAEAAAAAGCLHECGHLLPLRSAAEFCRRWRALREKHLPLFLNGTIDYREHHRRRMRDLFVDGPELSDREADFRYEVFLEQYRRGWTLFDDVPAGLDALPGWPLGVISNGSSEQQRRKLASTGILNRFTTIVISEEIGAAKPGSEIFLAACRRAACAPHECVYVGDRIDADVFSSVAAGLRGVWLNRAGPSDAAERGVRVIHPGAPRNPDVQRSTLGLATRTRLRRAGGCASLTRGDVIPGDEPAPVTSSGPSTPRQWPRPAPPAGS